MRSLAQLWAECPPTRPSLPLWPSSKMSSTCAHDFWWHCSVDKDTLPPTRPAPQSTVQNDALALPPRRQINQWKMSLPECRFVGVGVAAAAVCSPLCIWFYACLRATAEPWVTALRPWLHSDRLSPPELPFLGRAEKRFTRITAKRKETVKRSPARPHKWESCAMTPLTTSLLTLPVSIYVKLLLMTRRKNY